MTASEFNNLRYIKINKVGTKLIFEGFADIQKRELEKSTNWKCQLKKNKA